MKTLIQKHKQIELTPPVGTASGGDNDENGYAYYSLYYYCSMKLDPLLVG